MDKHKVDSVRLTEVIDQCLDYSMDGRLSQDQRAEFLALARRLRGSLVDLLSARFDKGTDGLESANATLATINAQLKEKAETLARAVRVLADLNTLVGSLDRLLGAAASFA